MVTTVKWSAFSAGSTIAGADTVVGLQGGVNVKWTWSQAQTYILSWSGLSGTINNSTFTLSTPTLSANDTLSVLGLAQAFTQAQSVQRDSIGTTSTDASVLLNTTAAAAGAQQYSPRVRWRGNGWKTNATAASQTVDFAAEVRPVQGTANPTGNWFLMASINGGAYADVLQVSNIGVLSPKSSVDQAAGHITVQNGYYIQVYGGGNIGVYSDTGAFTLGTSSDTILTRAAAASFRFGAADAAVPIAQTMQVQNVVAGTSNTTGVDWTYKGSRGTGTGAGGQIIFQTAPAGSTGTSQNALATALTMTAPAVNMQPSVVIGNQALATTATDGFLYIPTCAGTPTGVPTSFSGRVPIVYDTTNNKIAVYSGGAWKQTAALA